jgi:hypothetical protein
MKEEMIYEKGDEPIEGGDMVAARVLKVGSVR